MLLTNEWALLSSNKNNLLYIGLQVYQHPTELLPWRKNSSPLSWSWNFLFHSCWYWTLHLYWSNKSYLYQSWLLPHPLLVVWCRRVWTYYPLSPWQECHCKYIITAPILWNVIKSSIGECYYCPLWLYSQWPWCQQWSWFAQVLLNLPLLDVALNNPVDLGWIHNQQNIGTNLLQKQLNILTTTLMKPLDGCVIVYCASPNKDCHTQWKIDIAKEMVVPLIKWYCSMLAHSGCKQFGMTIQAWYRHPDITKQVDKFHFDYCQCIEIPCNGMGLLPQCDLTNMPWYAAAVDTKTEKLNGEFYALKCTDTTMNLVKLMCIDTKSSDAIAR